MALIDLPGPLMAFSGPNPWTTGSVSVGLNASGLSQFSIGQVYNVAGGSRTLSAAGGGSIMWRAGGATFLDAGSSISVGIQGVNASGVNDGTFSVRKEYIGGTDTINANAYNLSVMSSGSVTLDSGDIVAMGISAATIAGSDSVTVSLRNAFGYVGTTQYFPYRALNGATKASSGAAFGNIMYDDGTVGYIHGGFFPTDLTIQVDNFSFTTDPNEFGALFRFPFPCKISGFQIYMTGIAATEDFRLYFYDDPLGSPTPTLLLDRDADVLGGVSNGNHTYYFDPITLAANTWYAITILPLTANTMAFYSGDYSVIGSAFAEMGAMGGDLYRCERGGFSGAFTQSSSNLRPQCAVHISAIDDGTGGGGGGVPYLI